jgi:hypothetical protein
MLFIILKLSSKFKLKLKFLIKLILNNINNYKIKKYMIARSIIIINKSERLINNLSYIFVFFLFRVNEIENI